MSEIEKYNPGKFVEKIDVIELLLNIITEHERKLRDLIQLIDNLNYIRKTSCTY